MQKILLVVPALLVAGCGAAPNERRPDVLDARATVPPVEFRSAFQDYRSFADPELTDWRRANEEVGAAGGHAGHGARK